MNQHYKRGSSVGRPDFASFRWFFFRRMTTHKQSRCQPSQFILHCEVKLKHRAHMVFNFTGDGIDEVGPLHSLVQESRSPRVLHQHNRDCIGRCAGPCNVSYITQGHESFGTDHKYGIQYTHCSCPFAQGYDHGTHRGRQEQCK